MRIALLFVLVLTTTISTAREKNKLPWISVEGKDFVDESGDALIFKGLNASDPDKLEKDGHWNQEYFQQIRSWGANLVRLPVHPQAWKERGQEAYLELLDQGIEWAGSEGLYVIIDWHSIGNLNTGLFLHERYETTKKETYRFWITMANKYGSNSTVAFFELFNEPTVFNGRFGYNSWGEWKVFMEEIITIIRAHGAKNIPLVTGFNWGYDLTPIAKEPIDAEGVAYVSHPYPQKRDKPWPEKWDVDWGYVSYQYPVILTEIGYCEEGDRGAHVPVISDETYVDVINDYCDKRGISYVVWVFDPEWSPMLIEDWSFTPTKPGMKWREVLKGNKENKK